MAGLSLRGIAKLLGGDAYPGQALVPGPGHGPKDRSLSIRLSATDPDGFIVNSFADDDWRVCKDYVRERLGLAAAPRWTPRVVKPRADPQPDDNAARIRQALALWDEGVDPRGTLVERYLNSRALTLDDDLAGDVLRWHPRAAAMLALFRNIETGEPQSICRTFLDRQGKKIGRRFFGPAWGAAIMLDRIDIVLHVAEGLETGMAARQYDLRPTWALGSAPAIAAFHVIGGVERLNLLQENDAASERACEACAARWHAAGREVFIIQPTIGKDLNDAIMILGGSP